MLLSVCCLSAAATKQRPLLSHASSERPQSSKDMNKTHRDKETETEPKKKKKKRREIVAHESAESCDQE
jgi:hypothetical protein